MKQVPNNEQCKRLLEKHDAEAPLYRTDERIFAVIREAYRLGRDADVMKTKHKEEVK